MSKIFIFRLKCVDLDFISACTFIARDFSRSLAHNFAQRASPRVGPELGGGAVGGQLVRALETHYGLRVAQGDKFVRPDAGVGLGVVDQTGIAMSLMRLAVNAFDVSGAATVALRIHTELILAARAADRRVCKKMRLLCESVLISD